ncbi:CYFA0S03e01530g1_1 [Cyberlindnera fabianii]|uniref:CYFA0S03e01530g1_1 n=1 Tax=Cyberlindnera fabianii TaxID=36022 RepID=A0A061AQ31_CYBFA|nr:Nuclear protein STH1/NPS1 [Cyberlindnera fabianii]CDR39266.1 CYFA0S03e01530g1_1 [Cyberlindnera fabianii]
MSSTPQPVPLSSEGNTTIAPESSPQKKVFHFTIPRSTDELHAFVLRLKSLREHNLNPDEQAAIEKMLHQVSRQQQDYTQKRERLRAAQEKNRASKKTQYSAETLRDQLVAFQFLSKNLDVPEAIQERLNFATQKETTTSIGTNLSVLKTVTDLPERLLKLGVKDRFSNASPDVSTRTVGTPETERLILGKIDERVQELEKLPSNLGAIKTDEAEFDAADDLTKYADDLKIKALIELKSLRLLNKQKSIRQNLLYSIGAKAHTSVDYLKAHPITQSAQRSLQVRPKIVAKQTARLVEELEKQQKLEKQRVEQALHQQKVQKILDYTAAVLEDKEDRISRKHHFAKSIVQMHSQIEKDESKKLEKTARQRLQALKANDEEAYLKLLDQTKDTRITHLLKQTNSFLDSLARAVQTQQAEAKMANGETVEITDEEREKIDYFEVAHRVKEEIKEQPSILVGGTLKEYQLKGLQWMVSLYNNHLNGILADEMGLGKTIQTLSLITYLVEKKKQNGPFLVIVPLSTITNWTLEFEKWAPSLKTIVYKGTPQQRKNLGPDVRSGNFNVLLTTFEYIIKDRPVLSKLRWVHMIIDEGHRMKNANSKLSATIAQYYHTKNRLILTGTPLQNNLPELWALLNFVLPKVFNSQKTFDEWFNTPFDSAGGQEKIELSEEETLLVIRRLHKVLRPFLLRRLKKEVEKDLPDKVEKVIKCKLSGLQYVLYQQMLKHNALFVGAGASGATKSGIKGLNNKIMQLRKICNHPYVFEEVENVINPTRETTDMMWRCSGKFEILDRVLPKFKASGHKVLMFFQMTQVMDIMEDYLRYKDMQYLRLDGSTKADDRTGMLKVFNKPESEYFCFLLSTRAGGLGLNLQSADTVIIFDSDWNPHQDLQAQDRAHRIGQKNEVRILRLVTSDTVEEVILERALQKLDIDGKVIQAGKFDNKSTSEEQEAFLKQLLENEGRRNNDEDGEMDDDDLNDTLARNDAERELFSKMDLERVTAEKIQSRRGGWKERLLTDAELPEIFTEDIDHHFEVEDKELGRTREKKRVYYDDGLTEEQWLMAMDDDEDTVEAAIERKRKSAERRKKRASGGIDLDEEEPEAEVTPPTNGRAKRSRSATVDAKYDESVLDDDEEDTSVAKKPKKEAANWTGPALELLDELQSMTDETDGHLLSEYFIDLPSKKVFADYYKVISKPVAINTVRKRVKSKRMKSFDEFKEQVMRIYSNAKFYNEDGSSVFNDAVLLEEHSVKRFEEIEKSL